MLTLEEIRHHLTGPIASVHPPFKRDGSFDWDGLGNILDAAIAAKAGTMLLTYGDSLHSLITDDEVVELTRFVVRHTNRRAMVVASDRQWWTGKEVAWAREAREIGADMLMVLPPNWAGSATARTFTDHYRAVSEHIPVMLVTAAFAPDHAVGLETLKLLVREAPNVLAIKDDLVGEFARKMSLIVYPHWAVFSGGQKQNHLDLLPYGCDGYMSSFVFFRPDITTRYWSAIQAGDLASAVEVIREYDNPFFDTIMASTGSFDAAMHGVFELYGHAERWRRPPYHSLSDPEMERLADFFRSKGLL